MSKYTELFDYMRRCPGLANLWSIAATEKQGVRVILPQGASSAVDYRDGFDVTGQYVCEVVPYPSVYEDYQINCYQVYDPKDNSAPQDNINVLNVDEVQAICDWVAEQNEKGNLPKISGRQVVSIECNPGVPQIRAVNTQENLVAYFITVRVRYVNNIQRRSIEYAPED